MAKTAAPPKRRPYHHGDLRRALLTASERILEKEGMQGLTLRAAARAVGVTPMAPAAHFGDMAGLLSELAADGFRRFADALGAAVAQAGPEPRARAIAMGRGYVAFAKRHPGLFTLMFRSERLDPQRPALREALVACRQALQNIVAERSAGRALTPTALAAQVTALWSLAHGYATLMLEGRLKGTLAALPAGTTADVLFDAVLESVTLQTPSET